MEHERGAPAQGPWLSVVMPTFNGQRYLERALASLTEQSESDFEVIVVDAGSTDGTRALVERHGRSLDLRWIDGPERSWAANTTLGFREARGEFVCMLHQDDSWHPDRTAVLRRLARERAEVDLFLHAVDFIDEHDRRLNTWRCPLPSYPELVPAELLLERLLVQNFVATPAVTVRRTLALEVGGLDRDLWYTADWDFYLKVARMALSVYWPGPLASFRLHPDSLTVQGSRSIEDFSEQLDTVLSRHRDSLAGSRSRDGVLAAARFSNRVNVYLAAKHHGYDAGLLPLLRAMLALGPGGLRRYLRDSRITERAFARLRARLSG